jgi:hypothetical protein
MWLWEEMAHSKKNLGQIFTKFQPQKLKGIFKFKFSILKKIAKYFGENDLTISYGYINWAPKDHLEISQFSTFLGFISL